MSDVSKRPEPSVGERGSPQEVASKLGGSAALMFVRRILVTLLNTAGSVVVARTLAPELFGLYSAGMATYFLVMAFVDFGFAQVLGRRLGSAGAGAGAGAVRAVLRLSNVWAGAASVFLVVWAVAAGPTSTGTAVMMVMAPSIAMTGAGVLRQVFYAEHNVARLAAVDIAVNAGQFLGIAVAALLGSPPVVFAAVVSSAAVTSNAAVRWMARGAVASSGDRPHRAELGAVLKEALPIGVASVVASAYVSIDMILLPWLVSPGELGHYAAAVKFVSVATQVPILLASISLPAVSGMSASSADTSFMMARLWSWNLASSVPLVLAVGLFAPAVVSLAFGPEYAASAHLLAVLMGAALLMVASNIFYNLLVVFERRRQLVAQSVTALAVNVLLNVVLAPRWGVAVAAWATVVTELIVVVTSAVTLRGVYYLGPLTAVTRRVFPAVTGMVLVGTLWQRESIVAAFVGITTYYVLLGVFRGFPVELTPPRLRGLLCPAPEVAAQSEKRGRHRKPAEYAGRRSERTTVLVIRPAAGGVADVGRAVAARLGPERQVTEIEVPDGRIPALAGMLAASRCLASVRRAGAVHVELGRLSVSVFWCLVPLLLVRRDIAVVMHDVPIVCKAPGAGLLPSRRGLVDAIAYRLVAPAIDPLVLWWVRRRTGAIGVLSEAAEREVKTWGRPVQRIRHGAAVSSGGPAPSRGHYVLFAGYLGPSKGVEALVDAWTEIGDEIAAELWIVGEAATSSSTDWLADLQTVSQRAPQPPRWFGKLPEADFVEAFERAALVVLPYVGSNPASGILTRAIAAGRPVLTTRTEAARCCVIDSGAGVVIEGTDELASAIKGLMRDPGRRDELGARALSHAREQHSWERHLSDVADLHRAARRRR